jgi:hypothetical protein
MVFKWNDVHKPQVSNFMKERDCIWRTTSEKYRNKTARKNAIKTVHVPEFPKLNVKKEKLKKNCAGYAAGLSKVIKPHKNLSPIRHLHVEIVLVQTRTLLPGWRLLF